MQNRYVGDVGDFGKLGILRLVENTGLSVGVNWYLVGDENHNDDGKHIGYLSNNSCIGCDDELLDVLKDIVYQNKRNVLELEKSGILKTEKYIHEIINKSNKDIVLERIKWHNNALNYLKNCDIVFLDPDNGLIPPSVSRARIKSIKYVFPEEIIDYYKAGHSVMFYNHRTRETLEKYIERFSKLFKSDELSNAIIMGISYRRGTIRDYFFILHKEHYENIQIVFNKINNKNWKNHFNILDLN